MNRRFVAIPSLLFVFAGCYEPDRPTEPQAPPELTTELAKQALVEMLRDNPKALYGGPAYPTEQLAGEAIGTYENGSCTIGAFSVDLGKANWHLQSSGPGCIWTIDGKFELVGMRWTANLTNCIIANPGPGGMAK